MKIDKALLGILFGTATLGGCDVFNSKIPLSGKRENLFITEREIKPHTPTAVNLTLKPAVKNTKWLVAGGSLSHVLPILSAPAQPKEQWKTNIGTGNSEEKRLVSNLLATDTLVIGMDTQGVVTALNKQTGAKVWSVHTSPEDASHDTLGGGIGCNETTVFVTTSFGDVLALDVKTGKQLWKESLLTPIRIAPTIANGRVFVVTINNELHALNSKDGKKLWTHSGLPESTGLLGGGVPAIEDNIIVVPYSSGELYALRVENGYPVWTDTLSSSLSADSLSSISHIRARPLIVQGVLYAISHGGRMAAINVHSGIRLWEREISGVRTPAVVDQYLYLITINNELVCLNRHTGDIIWSTSLPLKEDSTKITWAGPIVTSQGLLVTGSNGFLGYYDVKDGKQHHHIKTGQEFSLSPVVVDNKIYTLNNSADLTAWH